jgi:histone H3/H4
MSEKTKRCIPLSPIRNRMRKLGADVVQNSAVEVIVEYVITIVDTITKRALANVKFDKRAKILTQDIYKAIDEVSEGLKTSVELAKIGLGIQALVDMYSKKEHMKIPQYYSKTEEINLER